MMNALIRKTAATALLLPLLASAAWAQFAGGYDPVGVDIDPNGVLKSRINKPDARLAELRKKAKDFKDDGKLIFISLPRLFERAEALLKNNKPLPADVAYLGGMVKLQYVFVYPDEKDIIIAGPAEPFDTDTPYRPLGKITGRPVLHLEDLVTALRSSGPGKFPDRVGCDINITKEIQDRIGKKARQVAPKSGVIGKRNAADQIAKAGGRQPVQYYALNADTRFAVVCVEADYRLKQLALGLFKTPVKKVRSYSNLIKKPELPHRFSLESDYEALVVTPDGNAFEFKGASLKVNSGLLGKPDSTDKDISAAALRFKKACNNNFAELTKYMVSWADLTNLADLSVFAALIGQDKLHDKIEWDLSWILKEYPVTKMKGIKSAQTLCNYSMSGRMILFTSGGVWIKPEEWAKNRTEGKLETEGLRPHGDDWSIDAQGK